MLGRACQLRYDRTPAAVCTLGEFHQARLKTFVGIIPRSDDHHPLRGGFGFQQCNSREIGWHQADPSRGSTPGWLAYLVRRETGKHFLTSTGLTNSSGYAALDFEPFRTLKTRMRLLVIGRLLKVVLLESADVRVKFLLHLKQDFVCVAAGQQQTSRSLRWSANRRRNLPQSFALIRSVQRRY